jgi:hypothetical protein
MDIFFHDPSDVPMPPDEVRIRVFEAEVWPDKRRIRIRLEVTPFQKRPHGEISIEDQDGSEVASFSIVEAMTPRLDFTVHLRGGKASGRFTASAVIFYYEEKPEPAGSGGEPEEGYRLPDHTRIVDQAATTFEIPES